MEIKSSKDEEFDSIYRAYADSIFQTVKHYTKNDADANDVTQQTFFQLYIHCENIADIEYIEAWLRRTAKNLLFNYSRDSKREILGEVVEVIMESKDNIGQIVGLEDHYLREEQKTKAKELSDSIFEELYKKNSQWYDALTLVYCLGKPQQEVADEMGITLEILHSRIYRAKQWIRKNYGKEYEKVVNWF